MEPQAKTAELREMVRLRVKRIDLVAEPANQRPFLAVKGDADEEMLEEMEVQESMGRLSTTDADAQKKVQKDASGGNTPPAEQAQPQPEPQAQAAPAEGTTQTTPAQPVDKAAQLSQALREIYDALAKHAASWPQEAKEALQKLAQLIAGNYQYAYPAPATGSAQKAASEALKAADVEAAIKAALDPVRQALEALQKSVGELAQKAADLDARLTHIEELRGVRKSAVGQQVTDGQKPRSIWGNILGPY